MWALLAAALLFCARAGARCLFVYPYRASVESECARRGLPPHLVAGLIMAESGFDRAAVSHAGAIGLMQLTPDTYFWLRYRSGERATEDTEALLQPATNITYGTMNLQLLLREFEQDEALAAYNAGPARVRDWLTRPECSGDGVTLSAIPYPETARYIKRVHLYAAIYRLLYYTP